MEAAFTNTMTFLTLLAIIFLVPLAVLVIRIIVAVVRVRRFMRDPVGYGRRQAAAGKSPFGGPRPGSGGADAGPSLDDLFAAFGFQGARAANGGDDRPDEQPPVKKKKIASDVGEYVDFVELQGSVTEHEPPCEEFIAASQVEDVQWVDLPDPADKPRK